MRLQSKQKLKVLVDNSKEWIKYSRTNSLLTFNVNFPHQPDGAQLTSFQFWINYVLNWSTFELEER